MSFVKNLVRESVIGTRYVVAMLIGVPIVLLIMTVLAWSQRSSALAAGAATAAVGWLWSSGIIYRASQAMDRGEAAELTPARQLVIPIVLIAVGILVPWRWA